MARPRLSKKVVRISVSLDHRVFDEVNRLVKKYDVSVAWMVRKAVTELLARQEQAEAAQPLLRPDPTQTQA